MKASERLADLQKQGFTKPMWTRRKPSRPKRDERTKAAIAAWTARFLRRSRGTLTKTEARELGARYGEDLHWKYLRVSGDKLALREPTITCGCGGSCVLCDDRGLRPGSFLRAWLDHDTPHAIASERRMPRRWASSDHTGSAAARHMGYMFGWYGPQSGIWPGDRLVFDERCEFWGGQRGSWVVRCSEDCPCSRHCRVCRTPADGGLDRLCEACRTARPPTGLA